MEEEEEEEEEEEDIEYCGYDVAEYCEYPAIRDMGLCAIECKAYADAVDGRQ